MKRVYALIAATMMLLPISAMADVAIAGAGNITCSKLGNDLSNPAINRTTLLPVYISWLQGYFSGQNAQLLLTQHEYRDVTLSVEDLERMLFAYCNGHPLASIFDAAINIYSTLSLKQTTPPNASSHR
jgi:hypothetical protein